MRSKSFIFIVFPLILILGIWIGCGKKGSIDPSPETTGLAFLDTVYASSDTLQAGGSLLITAKVVDEDNNPKKGVTVDFSTTHGMILNPTSAISDSLGEAKTTLSAPADTSDHQVTVTAKINGIKKDLFIFVKGIKEITPGEPFNLTLEITPASLPSNGDTTATVVATVTDINGDPVLDGTEVRFAAGEKFVDIDRDGRFRAGIDSLVYDTNMNGEWDAIGSIPLTGITADGQAIVTYIAGTSPQVVYIKATSGVAQKDGTVSLTPLSEILSIDLDVDSPSIQVKGTGGDEICEITATGYDMFGNTASQGLEITFEIVTGPDGGESLEDAGYGPLTKLTDSQGQATVFLYSDTTSGTIMLKAFSGGVESRETPVTVCSGPPNVISLSADPLNIRGWDYDGVQSEVMAIVNDRFGNPVPDGTAVYFSTEEGMVSTRNSVTTDGITTVTYYSCNPRNDGWAWVVGSTRTTHPYTRTIKDSVKITVSGPPVTINFIGYPTSLEANGKDKGKILVEVLDINNHFVVGGTIVKFETTHGTITGSATTEDGVHASIAEAEIISEVLDKDYLPTTPDNGIGATAVVTAKSGLFAANSVNINFQTTLASSEKSYIDIPTTVDISSQNAFSVNVKDYYGNPLGGHLLDVRSEGGGSVLPVSGTTDGYGVASGFIFSAPADSGKVSIIAEDTDPNFGGITLSKTVEVK